MPDPVRSPSSIPTVALAAALGVAAGQGDAMSSNRMLRILRAAEPRLYAHWAEQRLEAVTDAIREAINDAISYAHPQSLAERPSAEEFARATLGLEDRT